MLTGANNNQPTYQRIALSGGKNALALAFTNASTLMKETLFNDAPFTATKELSYWNVKVKIGIIIVTNTSHMMAYDERLKFVKKIFDWSWSNRIVHLFVLYLENDHNNFVFTYNPYKSNKIIQVDATELSMYFPDKSSNLYGHQLHISYLYEDASIRYTKNGFESRDGKMCEYILNGLNATYRVTFRENVTFGLYEALILNGSVDFTPRRYFMNNVSSPKARIFTYPVTIDYIILMMPAAKPFNQFEGFLKNFTVNNSIVLIIVPIVLIVAVLWMFRLMKSAKSMLLQSVVDVVNLLLTLDGGKHTSDSCSDRLFVLSLAFGGFFFTNGVLSIFISLLTQPVTQAEINTFDQFDKTSLKVAVPDPAYTFDLLQLAAVKGKNWTNRVEEAYRLEKFIYQMYSYNTRYAYFLTRSRSDVLIERQKHLSLRGYHIPQEYFSLFLTAYYIGSRAPFKERVDQLILQAFQAGLYDKWNRDTYPNLIKVGYFKKFDVIRDDPEEEMNVLVVPIYGWCLSVALFLIEIGYVQLKNKRSTIIQSMRRRNFAQRQST